MNTKSLFDQFLQPMANANTSSSGLDVKTLTTGAAAGGIMGLLLGSKSGLKVLGNAATFGGLAVVGGLAYRALRDWQDSKSEPSGSESLAPHKSIDFKETPAEYLANGDSPSSNLELALVLAMIAAAKADGKIDSSEQRRIFESIDKAPLAKADKETVFQSFDEVPSPEQISSFVKTLEHRSEVFLVSCLSADSQHPQVQAHLSKLAQALELPNELVERLKLQRDQE